jgi:tRNA (cytidine56-2'-O)-methyltransferase
VTVLRLGHRLVRDERISTHIGLVARAFGAQRLILTGADDHTIDSIRRIKERWGGNFETQYVKNWRELLKNWEGIVVHLTMYGQQLDDAITEIRTKLDSGKEQLLVVVGAEKVPSEVYSLAGYNVSVGSQPHSEVAALAVFLDRLFMGAELYTTFGKARLRIKPSHHGKKVEQIIEDRI